ncbi:hypothetical protein [Rhodobacteraceae bacterium DSL-40]|uniref:spike base protein, RCAP_Rcc01079 family n=1 Tax=Amaricoccus sp. B4 TaxID=3368557 RepID=UPI000DAD4BC7
MAIYTNDPCGPASGVAIISPNDVADIAAPVRAFLVNENGDVTVTMIDGSVATLFGLTAGTVYPFRIRKLHATGTTVTGLVGML